MHPSTEALLKFFSTDHLDRSKAEVVVEFQDIAHNMAHRLPDNAETTTCIRKLLEAKDCAVRATL